MSSICQGKQDSGVGLPKTTGNLLMQFFGYYVRERLGEICPPTMAIGRTHTGALADGVMQRGVGEAFGADD